MSKGSYQRQSADRRLLGHLPDVLTELRRGTARTAVGSVSAGTVKNWSKRPDEVGESVRRAICDGRSAYAVTTKDRMENVLARMIAGVSHAEALAACGETASQGYTWYRSPGLPELAAWYRAEVERITANRPPKPPPPPPECNLRVKVGRVYFVECGPGGPVKIGFTANPVRDRLHALQVACPFPLRLLLAVDAPQRIESWCHHRFSDSHIHGEWHHPTPDLLAFIASGPDEIRKHGAPVRWGGRSKDG